MATLRLLEDASSYLCDATDVELVEYFAHDSADSSVIEPLRALYATGDISASHALSLCKIPRAVHGVLAAHFRELKEPIFGDRGGIMATVAAADDVTTLHSLLRLVPETNFDIVKKLVGLLHCLVASGKPVEAGPFLAEWANVLRVKPALVTSLVRRWRQLFEVPVFGQALSRASEWNGRKGTVACVVEDVARLLQKLDARSLRTALGSRGETTRVATLRAAYDVDDAATLGVLAGGRDPAVTPNDAVGLMRAFLEALPDSFLRGFEEQMRKAVLQQTDGKHHGVRKVLHGLGRFERDTFSRILALLRLAGIGSAAGGDESVRDWASVMRCPVDAVTVLLQEESKVFDNDFCRAAPDHPLHDAHTLPLDQQPQWVRAQLNTFVRWADSLLDQRGMSLRYNLVDGAELINLVEIITGEKVGRYNAGATLQVAMVANVTQLFDFLERKGISLHGLNPTAIVGGNIQQLMGLLHLIIVKLVVLPNLPPADAVTEKMSPRNRLLRHLSASLKNIPLRSFKDLLDGRALCHLVNAIRPGSVDANEVDIIVSQGGNCLAVAFAAAEESIGVPHILEPREVEGGLIDEVAFTAYLSYFCPKLNPHKRSAWDEKLSSSVLSVSRSRLSMSASVLLSQSAVLSPRAVATGPVAPSSPRQEFAAPASVRGSADGSPRLNGTATRVDFASLTRSQPALPEGRVPSASSVLDSSAPMLDPTARDIRDRLAGLRGSRPAPPAGDNAARAHDEWGRIATAVHKPVVGWDAALAGVKSAAVAPKLRGAAAGDEKAAVKSLSELQEHLGMRVHAPSPPPQADKEVEMPVSVGSAAARDGRSPLVSPIAAPASAPRAASPPRASTQSPREALRGGGSSERYFVEIVCYLLRSRAVVSEPRLFLLDDAMESEINSFKMAVDLNMPYAWRSPHAAASALLRMLRIPTERAPFASLVNARRDLLESDDAATRVGALATAVADVPSSSHALLHALIGCFYLVCGWHHTNTEISEAASFAFGVPAFVIRALISDFLLVFPPKTWCPSDMATLIIETLLAHPVPRPEPEAPAPVIVKTPAQDVFDQLRQENAALTINIQAYDQALRDRSEALEQEQRRAEDAERRVKEATDRTEVLRAHLEVVAAGGAPPPVDQRLDLRPESVTSYKGDDGPYGALRSATVPLVQACRRMVASLPALLPAELAFGSFGLAPRLADFHRASQAWQSQCLDSEGARAVANGTDAIDEAAKHAYNCAVDYVNAPSFELDAKVVKGVEDLAKRARAFDALLDSVDVSARMLATASGLGEAAASLGGILPSKVETLQKPPVSLLRAQLELAVRAYLEGVADPEARVEAQDRIAKIVTLISRAGSEVGGYIEGPTAMGATLVGTALAELDLEISDFAIAIWGPQEDLLKASKMLADAMKALVDPRKGMQDGTPERVDEALREFAEAAQQWIATNSDASAAPSSAVAQQAATVAIHAKFVQQLGDGLRDTLMAYEQDPGTANEVRLSMAADGLAFKVNNFTSQLEEIAGLKPVMDAVNAVKSDLIEASRQHIPDLPRLKGCQMELQRRGAAFQAAARMWQIETVDSAPKDALLAKANQMVRFADDAAGAVESFVREPNREKRDETSQWTQLLEACSTAYVREASALTAPLPGLTAALRPEHARDYELERFIRTSLINVREDASKQCEELRERLQNEKEALLDQYNSLLKSYNSLLAERISQNDRVMSVNGDAASVAPSDAPGSPPLGASSPSPVPPSPSSPYVPRARSPPRATPFDPIAGGQVFDHVIHRPGANGYQRPPSAASQRSAPGVGGGARKGGAAAGFKNYAAPTGALLATYAAEEASRGVPPLGDLRSLPAPSVAPPMGAARPPPVPRAAVGVSQAPAVPAAGQGKAKQPQHPPPHFQPLPPWEQNKLTRNASGDITSASGVEVPKRGRSRASSFSSDDSQGGRSRRSGASGKDGKDEKDDYSKKQEPWWFWWQR